MVMAHAMYNSLLDLSNKLTRQYQFREIEFDENRQTLRLRLGEGTLVYLNLEKEAYDIFFTTNYLNRKALKVASSVNETTATAILETGPDSSWHLDGDVCTRLPLDEACGQVWLNFFLEEKAIVC